MFAETKIREGVQTMGALPTLQGGAPAGGTTGQVLTKSNNTDYIYGWSNPAASGITSITATLPIIVTPDPIISTGVISLATPTPTATFTPTATPTSTATPTPSATATATPTPTNVPAYNFYANNTGAPAQPSFTSFVAKTDYWDTTDFIGTEATSTHGLVPAVGGSSPACVRFLSETAPFWQCAGGGGTSGGAPDDAHYVTTRAESGLSAEFSLGSLAAGILGQSVSGSVATPLIITIGTGLNYNTGTQTLAANTPTPTPTATPSATATPTATPWFAFGTIAVSGQSDVVADAAPDTLTLAAGNAIILTTNASTDTVTLAVATPTATATATPSATATATPTPTPTATAVTLTIDGVAQQINTDRTWLQGHHVTFFVDGAGIVVSNSTKNPSDSLYFGGTLTHWEMVVKPSGSATVDVLRVAGTGLPVTSIVGGATKPAISSGTENSSSSFSGWTSTTLAAGDKLAITVSGASTCTYLVFTLYYQ